MAPRSFASPEPGDGPLFRGAARGTSRVFLLGFGEAKDDSWATSCVRSALESSEDLWLEVGHEAGSEPDAAARRERLTHDPAGRSFFDVLEPGTRARALDYCTRLGIAPETLAPLRPWSAFYTINGAYWSRHKPSVVIRYPEELLSKLATHAGKQIRHEMPSQLAFAEFMAAMPDAAQSQYITFLLDFLDDQTAGRNHGAFDWARGDTSTGERAVERMRTRTPDLYRIMQVERNAWWTGTIDQLLAQGGAHFIAVGQMHLLGPDGILSQLRRAGIETQPPACAITGRERERT